MTLGGVGSIVFLTDLDLGTNADVQLTLISRAFDVASAVLADRPLPMPDHLRCDSENAARETKVNVLLWMCWLVACRKILTSTLCQGRAGHTHAHTAEKT